MIRRRCNYTIGSFAKEIGVSRQIVSEWESGNKAIPQKRKEQISQLLGISEELIGEITSEQQEEIINKAMFTHDDGNTCVFNYIIPTLIDNEHIFAFFMEPNHTPQIEEYLRLERKRKNILTKLDASFHGKKYTLQIDKSMGFYRDCEIFGLFAEIYAEIWEHSKKGKALGRYTVLKKTLEAILYALRGEEIEEIQEENKDTTFSYENYDIVKYTPMVQKLTSEIKSWLEYETEYDVKFREKSSETQKKNRK